MANYHLHAKIVARSKGRSAVAAAAYRSASRFTDMRTGITTNYTRKQGVVYSEIMVPTSAKGEGSPLAELATDRGEFWNAVEAKERRHDAQVAREVEFSLPIELSKKQQIELAKKYVGKQFVDAGMFADICIHDEGKGNPHAHVLLTMRDIKSDGFGNKNRNWNKKELLEKWRENWANEANQALELAGIDESIDHRTLGVQGISREPQIHRGASVDEMEQRGIETDRGNTFRAIDDRNQEVAPVYRLDVALRSTEDLEKRMQDFTAKRRAYHEKQLELKDLDRRRFECQQLIKQTEEDRKCFEKAAENSTATLQKRFQKVYRHPEQAWEKLREWEASIPSSEPHFLNEPKHYGALRGANLVGMKNPHRQKAEIESEFIEQDWREWENSKNSNIRATNELKSLESDVKQLEQAVIKAHQELEALEFDAKEEKHLEAAKKAADRDAEKALQGIKTEQIQQTDMPNSRKQKMLDAKEAEPQSAKAKIGFLAEVGEKTAETEEDRKQKFYERLQAVNQQQDDQRRKKKRDRDRGEER